MVDYAQGGPVLGRVKSFAKEENKSLKTRFGALPAGKSVDFINSENEFTDPAEGTNKPDEDNKYAKEGDGKGSGCFPAPEATSK